MGPPAADSAAQSRAQSWPGPLSLLIELPAGECMQAHVARCPFVIGRLDECDLTLRDNRISRRHARIRLTDGAYHIDDLGSRHGLRVNGERVRTSRLAVGDRIAFGVEDAFATTVCDVGDPEASLLGKVASLSGEARPASALGRLAAALEVARTMEASEGVDVVFEAVVDAALSLAGADRAFLLLRNAAGELETRVARDRSSEARPGPDLEVPLAWIADALDRRSELFSMSIGDPTGTGGDPDSTSDSSGPRTAVCVPILRMRVSQESETSIVSARSHTLGALYMDRKPSGTAMAESSRVLLQALAIEISTVLENARLIEEEREKRRLEQELRTARQIQRGPAAARFARRGLAGGEGPLRAELAGRRRLLRPHAARPRHLGRRRRRRIGQGRRRLDPGCLAAGRVLPRFRPGPLAFGHPRADQSLHLRAIRAIPVRDRVRARHLGGRIGPLEQRRHCAALVVRGSGAVERLPPGSAPVGVLEETRFAEEACTLLPGDKLVIYSDGATERRSPSGEEYGETRLTEAAAAGASLGAAELLDALLDSLRAHAAGTPQADDLTLLAIGYLGSGP